MIKIQTDHSKLLINNVSKHLDPLKQVYEAQGSQYKNFIQNLKDLDINHAYALVEMTKKLKELVKTNLQRTTDQLKKTVDSLHSDFIKKTKKFNETKKEAEKLY